MRPFVLRSPLLPTLTALVAGWVLVSCSVNQVGLGAKVDITPPVLKITAPSKTTMEYKKGTVVVTGTVADDLKLKSLTAIYPSAGGGDKSVAIKVSGKNWSLSIPSATAEGLAEGEQTVTVTAADASGKSVSDSVIVFVDNSPPLVLVQTPTTYSLSASDAPLYTAYIDIKGEVYDASGVRQVSLSLLNAAGAVVATKSANGTANFSARFNLKNDPAGTGILGSDDDGKVFTYTVTATDKAGTTNTWYYHRDDIYAAMNASAVPSTAKFPAVDELGALEIAGMTAPTTSPVTGISSEQLAAVRKTLASHPFGFAYQHTAAPRITFTSVNEGASPSENLLAEGSSVSATIEPPPVDNMAIVENTVVSRIYQMPGEILVVTQTGKTSNQELKTVGNAVAYTLALKNGSTSLVPGSYRLQLTAQANGSSPITKTVDFFIDSGAPSLAETAFQTLNQPYRNAAFSLGGTAAAAVGVTDVKVYQSYNGGAEVLVGTVAGAGSPGETLPWTVPGLPSGAVWDGSGAKDGIYDYTIVLTAKSGKKVSLFRSVTLDTIKPAVEFNSVAPVVGTNRVNGTVTFSAGVQDINGIQTVRWAFASTEPTDWAAATAFSSTPYIQAIDTTAFPDNTTRSIFVRAQDKAGNYRVISKVLAIDQSSDNPAFALLNVDGAVTGTTLAQAKANLLQNGAKILGTASDDDAIVASTLEVSIDGGGFSAVTRKGADGLTVSFEQDVSGLADGVHTVQLRVADKNGLTATRPGFSFLLDTSAPTLTVTSSSAWQKTSVEVTGTASDLNGLAAVDPVVVTDDKATPTKTSVTPDGSGTWATPALSLAGVPDGVHTWSVTATDAVGKTTTQAFTVQVDQTVPTVTPTALTGWKSGLVTLGGTASDGTGSGLNQVEFRTGTGSWTTANGTGSWSTTLDTDPLAETTGSTPHTITVRSTDNALNMSAEVTVNLHIDRTAPRATMTVGPTSRGIAENGVAYREAAFTLSGLSGDDVSTPLRFADTVSLTSAKDGAAPVTLTLTDGGLDDGTWNYSQPVTGSNDGLYVYTLTVTDRAGKASTASQTVRIDTTVPTISITSPVAGEALPSSTHTLTGTASDLGSGMDPATLVYSLNGGAAAPASLFGASWSVPSADLGSTEGTKTLSVTGRDKLGNLFTTPTVTFYYDVAPPTVAETTLATTDTVYTKATSLGLAGTLTDSNQVLSLTVTGTKDGAALAGITVDPLVVTDAQHASWTATAPLSGNGLYVFTITGRDVANKTHAVQRTVRVDTTPPTVTPAAFSGWKSGLVTVKGSAADSGGSGLKRIEYQVDAGLWTEADGTGSWSAVLDTDSLSETTAASPHTVQVRATDQASNVSSVSTVLVSVDRTPPEATLDAPATWTNLGTAGSPNYFTNTGFLLTGTDGDDLSTALRLAASAVLSISKDGGTAAAVVLDDDGLTDGIWSEAFPVTGSNDGLYTFSLTVTDAAGKVSTASKTVQVDTKAPSLLINSVTPSLVSGSDTFLNGTVNLSVSSSDDNGLAGVRYFLTATATPPGWSDAGGTAFPSAPYTTTLDTTTRTDGTWYLHVLSQDKTGNTASAAALVRIDQTTDIPTAAIDSPSDGLQIGADRKVRGSFSDDDGVASGKAILRVKKHADGSYTSFPISPAAAAGQLIAWNVDLTPFLTSGGDGVYDLYLHVEDLGSSPKTKDTAVQTFTYDNDKPTVSSLAVSPAKTAYKAGDVLTLSWTAYDASGLASQTVDADGTATGLGSVVNPSGTNYAVSYTVPPKSTVAPVFESGTKTITLVTEDGTGKTTTKTVTILADVDPPAVENALALSPAFIGFTPNGTFTFKGTASDNRGLSQVQLLVDGPSHSDGATWQTAALDAGNWSLAVNSTDYAAAAGTLTIQVRSVDQAGNISPVQSFTQAVDQAADKPTVSVISPVHLSTYGTTVQVSGTAADDDNLADGNNDGTLDSDAVQVEYWNTATPASKTTVAPTLVGSGRSATFNVSLSGLAGGTWAVHVRAKDDAGLVGNWSSDVQFNVNAGAPNLALTQVDGSVGSALSAYRANRNIVLTGTADDNDGVTAVQVRINGGGWTSASTTATWGAASVPWTFALDLGADGLKTLEIQARDSGGFVANQQLSTTVDTKFPTGAFDVLFRDGPTGSFLETTALNKMVRITGTVTELNLADTSPIELFIDGAAVASSAVNGTFVWDSLWDTSALTDGAHTLALRITDKAGNVTNTAPLTVTTVQAADQPGVASTLNPAATADLAGSNVLGAVLKLSGTFTDDDGFLAGTIKLLLDADVTPLAATNTAGTSGTWEYTWSSLTSGQHYVRIVATDRNGASVTTPAVYFLVDSQNPDLALTAPSAGAKIRAGTLSLSGTASDAGGLGTSPLVLTLQHSNTASPLHGAVYHPAVSSGTWTQSVPIDGASLDGTVSLNLTLTDRAGKSTNVTRTIILDTTPPSLSLNYPSQAAYINGLVSVNGTADDTNGLAGVTMEILDPVTKLPKTPELTRSGATLSSWTFSLNSPSYASSAWAEAAGTGLWKVYFRLAATDNSGNVRVLSERSAEVTTVSTSTGALTLAASAAAALSVNDKITLDADTVPSGWAVGATYYIKSKTSTSVILAATAGGPALVPATSGAGVRLNSGSPWFIIDTDGDKPSISVTQPKNGDQIGGIVNVYGSASDDDGPVMRAEMRIDFNGDGDFADTRDLDGDSTVQTGADTAVPVSGILLRTGNDGHRWEDESAWYVVPTTSDVFTVELNAASELYASRTGGTGQIVLQIRSRDKFGLASEISTRTITLDETFPRIENVVPNDQTYQNGTFNLQVDFGDNIDLNLSGNSKIRLTLQKAGYQTLTPGTFSAGTHPYTLTAALGAPQHGYKLTYPVDTAAYFPGSSGVLYADLFVQDESTPSPYQNQKSMTFYVDNQRPDLAWSTRIGAPDGILVPLANGMTTLGTSDLAYVEGDYGDSGTVSGVSHIELFFVKDGKVERIRGGSAQKTALATEADVPVETFNGTDWVTASGTQALAKNSDPGFGSDYVLKIDQAQEMTSSFTNPVDLDGDGVYEFLGIVGAQRFRAAFDTGTLADGLTDLHMIIYDQVGNTRHKVRQIFVANNKPEITKVELGTDLNGNGALDAGELSTSHDVPPAETVFTSNLKARSNRVYLRITAAGGNGTKRYSVVHNGVERNVSLTTGIVEIDTSALTDSSSANDKLFTLKVFDSTTSDDGNPASELYDSLTVKLGIYNTDSVAPTIAVAPFGQTYPDASDETLKSATGALSSAADNLKAPGLGHVEYAADSLHNGTDADVSGQVVFKGKVHDDQRIQWITAEVPGFDGGNGTGVEFNVYASGSALTGTDWAFSLTNGYLTADYGHTANWNFTLDTARVGQGAGDNLTPVFRVYDFKTAAKGTTSTGSASLTVDVVPYITDISRQAPFSGRLASNTMNPGRDGWYPVYQGASGHLVTGFNLLASTTQTAGTNDIKVGTTALTVTAASAARTSLTVTLPATLVSGALTVTVNGVASNNNTNDNARTYNQEGYTVQDDRLVYVDDQVPTIAVAPFGQKYPVSDTDDSALPKVLTAVSSYSENLKISDGTDGYTSGAKEGHVEYAADSAYNAGTADVSGWVVFKGKAADNQRISRITAKIPGFNGGTEFDIYQIGDADGLLSGTGWSSSIEGTDYKIGTNGVAKGHVLNWSFTWNSALITNTAQAGVAATFTAYDANATPLSAVSTLTVDVVPYITALTTGVNSLLGKDYNRSALGRYPVWVNSAATTMETVTVTGFNLKPSAVAGGAPSDVRLSIDPDGLDAGRTVRQGLGLMGSAPNAAYTSLTVQLATAASTPVTGEGYLTILTNGVPTLNNLNAAASYNQETTPLHASLYDDRRLQVWDLKTLRTNTTYPTMSNATYPTMMVNGTTPVFAYVNNSYGYGQAHYWNGTASTKIYEAWDLFTNSALDLNSSGSRAALYNINIVWQGKDYTGDAGGLMVNFFYNPPNTNWDPSGGTSASSFYRPYSVWMENLNKTGNLAVLGRYNYPDISVVGDNTNTTVFTTTYDSIDDRTLFRTYKVGTNSTSVGSTNNLKGGEATNLYTNLEQYNAAGTFPTFQNNSTNNQRFTSGSNNNAGKTPPNQQVLASGTGQFSAVDATSTGVALAAYYKAATNQLVYRYNTTPTNSAAWSSEIILDTDVGGDFVDMAVENSGATPSNIVHLAYHDSFSGDLKYLRISAYNGTVSGPYKVDSYLTVGNKLSLSLGPTNVPFLAYKGMGNTAKAAWLATTLGPGADADDKFTGRWESVVIPTKVVDSDSNRFSIGVGTDGRPVIGYSNANATGKGLEYLTRLDTLTN